MGHGKETPRQKMISVMYLFLTSLMALNVSKDVLNSFVLVSDSLEKTVENYRSKNQKVYDEFEKQMSQNANKVGPWKDLADNVRKLSDELYQILEGHKKAVILLAEGSESEAIEGEKVIPSKLASKDNIDIGGQYFILSGHGKELKEKINTFRDAMLGMVPEKEHALRLAIESTLDTKDHQTHEDEPPHPWESANFEHIPLIADLVMLAKLQADVKNIETDVVNYLYKQIDASSFKFNKIEPIVIPRSNYIMKGDKYYSEIFIAASDSNQAPKVYIGDYKRNEDGSYSMVGPHDSLKIVGGRGIYEVSASSVGERKYKGLIVLKRPDEGTVEHPFESEYQIAEPNLVISPTKMNVFYAGIPNPVAVSVPGIRDDQIKASITGDATMRKVKDGYEVVPKQTSGEVDVVVKATIQGTERLMGKLPFRIKKVPDPKARVMGQDRGTIQRNMLLNAPGVMAEMDDFVFDLKFRVSSFKVSSVVGGYTQEYTTKGNKFSQEQKDLIKNIKSGSTLIVEDIEAVGPDGIPRPLSPIVFKVK